MSDNKNLGDILRNLPKNELAKLINELSEEEANQIYYDWQGIWCRDNQRYDPNWPETITIYLAGRGFGKTRLACEAIRQEEARGTKLFTICAPTAADIRDTIITGPSGILSCYPPDDKRRPTYYPSYSRLEWPSGAVARLISAENSERARGINTGFLYLDEVGSIDDIDIFHQLMFGLRAHPSKCIITTTPRANAIMIELSKRFGKDVRVITGSTYDNASNLTDSFITSVREAYEGTSLGESELHGKLILSSTDALWQQQTLMDNTIEEYEAPNYVSFSIGVDPAVSKGKHSDLTGIVVVALGEDDKMYVLGDFSGKYSPQQWSQKVVSLYDMYSLQGPTSIVVERNQGGDLVEDTLSRERPFLPIKEVFATANKMARMQPIALLYEQGKVKHIRGAGLGDLESEQISFDGRGRKKSPDRIDSLVMACMSLSPARKNKIVTKEFRI